MVKRIGEHAAVIGAGVGGLLFARALADYFETVTVLERDSLPGNAKPRKGVPQGRHPHGLLAGGCRAMDALLPGLVDDFTAAGAVRQVAGLSTRFEMPGYDPFPRRDLGFSSYGLSRPLLELCVRRRVQAIANVSFAQKSVVECLQHHAGTVTGVALRGGGSLPADLVIDASGCGALTLRALDEMGYARPRQTTIGVDLRYATALFDIPKGADHDWQVLMTYPSPLLASSPNNAPESFKAALVSTIEGNRWICTVAWQGEEEAPADRESFVEFTRTLRTKTCYHAIKDATMLGAITGFLFRESYHRHFGELQSLPNGLLPVADAICSFNPLYGQGMSVAALEAEAFHQLLGAGHGYFQDLSRAFLQRTDQIIAPPWNMAALPDLAYPNTRGERPVNLMQLLQFDAAFRELAARDASVHKLRMEITSLLSHSEAVTGDPVLMQRIQAVMVEMAQAKMAETVAV